MWIRTFNGALNLDHVKRIYAFNSTDRGWVIVADLAQRKPDGTEDGYVLNLPELTVSIKNEIDARKAVDNLVEMLEIQD